MRITTSSDWIQINWDTFDSDEIKEIVTHLIELARFLVMFSQRTFPTEEKIKELYKREEGVRET